MTDYLLPDQLVMEPERKLLVAVIAAAVRDAEAGDQTAISFLTDRRGIHATSRRDWLSHTDLDDEVFRRGCCRLLNVDPEPSSLPRPAVVAAPEPKPKFRRADFYAGRTLERCLAGSQVARIVDLLSQGPRTFEEICTILNLTEEQLRNALWQTNRKGYGFATCRNSGQITIEYPRGMDRPIPHKPRVST